MKHEPGNVIVGAMMVPMGLFGLLIASRAMDSEMALFGASLTAFAAIFGFSLIKRHYDQLDAAKQEHAEHG